jgi:hypothetical protein
VDNCFVLNVCSSIVYGETTELEGDANDEQIKIAYRRLVKFYHPDGMCLNLRYLLLFLVCH